MPHTDISIDAMYVTVPADDTQAFAAFCNEAGCTWRGDWHHLDTDDDAEQIAQDDADEHTRNTESPDPSDMDGDDYAQACGFPSGR